MFSYVLFMLIMHSATFLSLYSDDELLSLILPKLSEHDDILVVNSKTDRWNLKESYYNGFDCQPLIRQFTEKNQESVELTLKSDLSKGYFIDKNGTITNKYNSKSSYEKWLLRRENLISFRFISVSLPVYDKQRNLVLIYKNSAVTGEVLCYKFNNTNGALEELKTELVWIE
ncbi:hypothetical protein I4U23_011514 [Adineta vaga]|nr:hypothetical protein I4U23_011514 [Adineta vaga]